MSLIDDLKKTLAEVQDRYDKLQRAVEKVVDLRVWADQADLGGIADDLSREAEDIRGLRAAAADRIDNLKKRIEDAKNDAPRPGVMYDAVTVANIPAGASAVGCYVGPSTFTCEAAARRCPDARRVKISQAGMSTTPADCVDVEPQDATNDTGTKWLKRKLAGEPLADNDRKVPVVYTNAGNASAFINFARSNGVDRSQYRLWSAHVGRGEHICSPSGCGYPQADGTQWTFTALGRDLDQSKLNPSFWD